MTISELQQQYALHPNVSAAQHLLQDEQVRNLFLSGLCGSAAPLFASSLMGRVGQHVLYVLGDVEEAGYFYHDLVQLLGEEQVMFFPSSFRRAIKYGQKDAANEILRTEVLSRLEKGSDASGLFMVSYPEALAEKVVSRGELQQKTLKLHEGEQVDMDFVT